MVGKRTSAGPVLLVGVLCLGIVAGPALAKSVLTPEEQAFLDDHGPLRVLLAATGPPLAFPGADGAPQGIQPDFLQLMGIRFGIPFNVTLTNRSSDIFAAIDNGTHDLVGPMLRTPEREQAYHLIGPIYWSRVGFWVTDRTPEILTPADLDGRTVGVSGQGFLPRLQEAYPNIRTVAAASAADGVQRLVAGEFDALYAGYTSVGYIARNLDLRGLRTLGEPDQIVESYWATSPAQPMVGSILDAGWRALEGEPRLDVYLKWTGLDLGPPPAAPAAFWRSTAFVSLLGGALLVVSALAVGLILLRVAVARRTRQLRSSEARLRALIESAPVGVASVTPEGRLESVSAALERLIGSTLPLSRARPLENIIHPDDWPAFHRLHTGMREGTINQYARDARLRTFGGQDIRCHWSAVALRDEKGRLETVALLVEDLRPRFKQRTA